MAIHIKQNMINTLNSHKGLSLDCDDFIERALLAIGQTDSRFLNELYEKTSLENCLVYLLLDNDGIRDNYSEAFIIEAVRLVTNKQAVFVA